MKTCIATLPAADLQAMITDDADQPPRPGKLREDNAALARLVADQQKDLVKAKEIETSLRISKMLWPGDKTWVLGDQRLRMGRAGEVGDEDGGRGGQALHRARAPAKRQQAD